MIEHEGAPGGETSGALRPTPIDATATPGNEILRLRTQDGAAARGHALLIGVPLDGLGGVDRCLAGLRGWLEPGYSVVERREGSTMEAIETSMQRLHDEIQPGDQVLVYYAGHGLRMMTGAGSSANALSTMSARRRDLSPAQRVLSADALVEKIQGLARASGAGVSKSLDGASTHGSVTVVFDSCHSAGLMDAWPEDPEHQLAILQQIAAAYDRPTRGPKARVAGVLWVLAARREQVAHGLSSGEVGLFTQALVTVLREHPNEPWWAVMDRVRARWNHEQQSPALCGPSEVVPLAGFRVSKPREWLPCHRLGPQQWRVEMGDAAGWQADERVALTPSLVLPALAEGQVERLDDGSVCVRTLGEDGLEGERFAWAYRRDLVRSSTVEVWGGTALAREQVIDALEGRVRDARDLGSALRDEPYRATLGLALDEHGVTVRDGWGDALARTSISAEGLDSWLYWIERTTVLDRWIAVERAARGWHEGGFELRMGTWGAHGEPTAWSRETPTVTPETPLWIGLADRKPGWPAYAGLFRVCGDRSIAVLTEDSANGSVTLSAKRPEVKLGARDEPLRLPWPMRAQDGEERSEEIVAVVSNRPLTFSLLGSEETPRGNKRMRGSPKPQVKLAMLRLRYRLRR